MSRRKTVFVGLSGGVDSSVVALRLVKQNFNVVGVFIKVWHPDFLVCSWEQERLEAMRVAAKLGIPFMTCDAEDAYRDAVASYFIESYRQGQTPNPDVMCNKEVKFGVFLDFALKNGADFIATGHYAQNILNNNTGNYELHRGFDINKDQSYFLWTLTQKQLAHVLFPVGDTTKDAVRIEAKIAGLDTATKKDSQGICFLGHIDIPDFLGHYIDLQPGKVYDEQGEIIGEHKGAFVYTVGQRHGFTVFSHNTNRQAYFVTDKDIVKNTITVSSKKPILQQKDKLVLNNIQLSNPLPKHGAVQIQTRYRQKPNSAIVTLNAKDNQIFVCINEPTEAVASGQSCVLYDDTVCLGGGIIV